MKAVLSLAVLALGLTLSGCAALSGTPDQRNAQLDRIEGALRQLPQIGAAVGTAAGGPSGTLLGTAIAGGISTAGLGIVAALRHADAKAANASKDAADKAWDEAQARVSPVGK